MKNKPNTHLEKLKSVAHKYDEASYSSKLKCLQTLSSAKLDEKILTEYADVNLFLIAYADDKTILKLVEKELARIAGFLKNHPKRNTEMFFNSGLPFTKYESSFTHDCVDWLLKQSGVKLSLDCYNKPKFDLNDVLKFTLPSLEKSQTTSGWSNEELLAALAVDKENEIPFIINELSKLNHSCYIKDHLFEGLGLFMNMYLIEKEFSKPYNRLAVKQHYYHTEILKNFEHTKLLNTPIPAPTLLSEADTLHLERVIKTSMALTDRETDATTFMTLDSLKLFELERGVSIALYAMIPERQLPVESYVGYTLFKNGLPVGYGCGWVFAHHSDFAFTIFDQYRGGESAYLMMQVLRVYRQLFKINYFEVEPFQFGLDNPDGIASAAYLFYFKNGFRSLDKDILKLSLDENEKIKSRKGYKINEKTLLKFTECPLGMLIEGEPPLKVYDITKVIALMIHNEYNDDRIKAVKDCILRFRLKTEFNTKLNQHEQQVLQEVALWCCALKINSKTQLALMVEMIHTKPVDVYAYQELVLRFMGK